MQALNKNIKKLRLLKGMNQSEFAQIFELTRANIGSYEEGRAQPKISVITAIAAHFGLSLDQFVNEELTINELSSFSLLKENPPVYRTPGSLTVKIPYTQVRNFRKYISLGRTKDFLNLPKHFSGEVALEMDNNLCVQIDHLEPSDVVILEKIDPSKIEQHAILLIWTNNTLLMGYGTLFDETIVLAPSPQSKKQQSIKIPSIDRIWQVTATLSSRVQTAKENSLLTRIDNLEQKLTTLILSK